MKKQAENELKKEYNKTANLFAEQKNEENLEKLETLKNKIETLNKEKTEGTLVRSKALELNSKLDSSYYKSQEKTNYKTCHIVQIENEKGQMLNNEKEILNEIKSFYYNLYTEKQYEPINKESFLNNNIPKLDDTAIQECEKEITLEECSKALKKMKNRKTPGTDGFTVEFYKMFWTSIKDLVLESFYFAFDIGELSIDQKRGIIKLLPKKDKILKFLKNWRPISLLNTDYKILAHILASRLQHVLPQIIHPDQNGYIKNRFIGCNIRTIYDVIDYSENKYDANLITFIDYEKAFDNIKISYLMETLKNFGFGETFQTWIKIMYTNISSCVMNNGFSSIFFPLSKGVRQGCPLSALLFILVVETLAIEIRNNPQIVGVKFQDKEVKISLLADDTTIFTEDVRSLQIALNVIKSFKNASGLRINQSKTKLMQVGLNKQNTKTLKIDEVEKIHSLGICFFTSTESINTFNFDTKFKQFKGILQYWESKKLNILERIKVVKTYALSKLHYTMASLEITEQFVENVQKEVNSFIWDGKKPKIKQKVAYQSIENGGLAIPNIELFMKANRAMWIKRLLMKNNRCIEYLKMFLPKMDFSYFIKCNYNPVDLPQDIPRFYYQILFAWFNLKKEPQTPLDIRRELIVLNQYISIDNKYVYNNKLILNKKIMINDFFKPEGKPLSYNEFIEKEGNIVSFFDYIAYIDAIPRKWKKLLRNQTISTICFNINEQPVCHISNTIQYRNVFMMSSRELYWSMLNENLLSPSCINAWNKRLVTKIENTTWEKLFILPFKCTQNIHVKDFQLKIIHRFYASNSLVSKWDKDTKGSCDLCKFENANILHIFVECPYTQKFWENIDKWLRPVVFPYTAELDSLNMLFGIVPYSLGNHCVNHCLIYCRFFIHSETRNSNKPTLNKFIQYYKYILQIEKETFIVRNELKLFSKLFGKIVNIM